MPSISSKLKAPQSSKHEEERIKVLREYFVLDTEAELDLDKLAGMAARACDTPIALISLVDTDRQWFKAKIGLNVSETPRYQSFCAHALDQTEVLTVQDATQDDRFALNPLVTGEPGIRFYAGAPLVTPENMVLGTLCVIDQKPRKLHDSHKWFLQFLAKEIVKNLGNRRLKIGLGAKKDGHFSPGIHDISLEHLQMLCGGGRENSAQLRTLFGFLIVPVLSNKFSHAYISGSILEPDRNGTIGLTLSTRRSYADNGVAQIQDLIDLGHDCILEFFGVDLGFWIEGFPTAPSDKSFLISDQLAVQGQAATAQPILRVDLQPPEMREHLRRAMYKF